MKTPQISILALVAVCLGACLSEAPRPAPAGSVGSDRPYHVIDSAGREQLVVRNANDCAPWLAEAVWGPGTPAAAPSGYRCFPNPTAGRW